MPDRCSAGVPTRVVNFVAIRIHVGPHPHRLARAALAGAWPLASSLGETTKRLVWNRKHRLQLSPPKEIPFSDFDVE